MCRSGSAIDIFSMRDLSGSPIPEVAPLCAKRKTLTGPVVNSVLEPELTRMMIREN